jgi:type II restriction enzyme
MPANSTKTRKWKEDIRKSVDMYNDWFIRFAPKAYRDTRAMTTETVKKAMATTRNMRDLGAGTLRAHPEVLSVLRMATCPPLAVDRLIGLAGVPGALVKTMEKSGRLPPKLPADRVAAELNRVGEIIQKLVDRDILVWLNRKGEPSEEEVYRASTVVADRLCGAQANPIIRNAQEQRQLNSIKDWLVARDYKQVEPSEVADHRRMQPGTFCFRLNVNVRQGKRRLNVPVDVVIMPMRPRGLRLPLLVEAKSAGDYTNVNKRRKEEATKVFQLRETYGRKLRYVLFLGGYFDSGYLGYEASEGMDWVWEHRIDDFARMGL